MALDASETARRAPPIAVSAGVELLQLLILALELVLDTIADIAVGEVTQRDASELMMRVRSAGPVATFRAPACRP